jgi:hypothetical protein
LAGKSEVEMEEKAEPEEKAKMVAEEEKENKEEA